MNEKIKQLWDDSIEEFSKQHQYATIMLPEPLREKFAELIVKECIDICKERHWTWRWDETTSGPNECANIIKERFGVEE